MDMISRRVVWGMGVMGGCVLGTAGVGRAAEVATPATAPAAVKIAADGTAAVATQPDSLVLSEDPNWIGPHSWQRHYTLPKFVETPAGMDLKPSIPKPPPEVPEVLRTTRTTTDTKSKTTKSTTSGTKSTKSSTSSTSKSKSSSSSSSSTSSKHSKSDSNRSSRSSSSSSNRSSHSSSSSRSHSNNR